MLDNIIEQVPLSQSGQDNQTSKRYAVRTLIYLAFGAPVIVFELANTAKPGWLVTVWRTGISKITKDFAQSAV